MLSPDYGLQRAGSMERNSIRTCFMNESMEWDMGRAGFYVSLTPWIALLTLIALNPG